MLPAPRGESVPELRIFRQFIGQEFQGDKAAKLGVLSLVDHTHATASELFDNAVVRDSLADHYGEAEFSDASSYGGHSGESTNEPRPPCSPSASSVASPKYDKNEFPES